MQLRAHTIQIDAEKCIGCVDCCKACPTKAIRVRNGVALVKPELCIDCGACVQVCRHDAVRPLTSSPSDLKRFRYTVAIPSLTLYGQFGPDVDPAQVLRALRATGFDDTYDISWMCEMIAQATDAFLSDCRGPWPRISVTCPAIVRLVQIRYPDLIPHLVPIETARELGAKMVRRRLSAQLGCDPDEIGIFFITPCTGIMNSIVNPVGMEQSHLDGAFSIGELYGELLHAIKAAGKIDEEPPISPRGLLWAMAGGELAGMRNASTMTVRGVHDTEYVFDRIESGKFQSVDFIEAYICPDGCVSGQLTIEGRFAAQRNIQRIVKRLGAQDPVKEEKVRSLLRAHFFDLEERISARQIQPLARDLRAAIAMKREMEATLERLPKKDCAACGAPDCRTLAEEVLRSEATIEDCPFVRIESLMKERIASGEREGGEGA